jgi:MinD superfamily P-loop ATPase
MIISVASGNGGTGKTMIATSLALAVEENGWVQLLDCDVEEPNAHIFLKPMIASREPVNIPVPHLDQTKCTYCGKCAQICAYNAMAIFEKAQKVLVFPELCHGCGACSYLCPEDAISEEDRAIGYVEMGRAGGIDFVHGKLDVGQAMAPPVIRKVKQHINPEATVIIDVPPGTSCPVVEAVEGSDFCILVTEPTPFGLNDLVLAVEVVRKLEIPFGVIINRAGVGDSSVEEYCTREAIEIILTVPLETRIAGGYSQGLTLIEALPEWKDRFTGILHRIVGRQVATPR